MYVKYITNYSYFYYSSTILTWNMENLILISTGVNFCDMAGQVQWPSHELPLGMMHWWIIGNSAYLLCLLGSITIITQIARFMGPTWGPPGSCRPQVGPMLAPWTLLSGYILVYTPESICYPCLWSQLNKIHSLRKCMASIDLFQYKDHLIRHRGFRYKDKMVIRPSHFLNQLHSI